MNLNLEIFSKAMFSSYLYHVDSRCLFDSGDGCSTNFGNYCFGIENIFISHSDNDHIGSLAGIIYSRDSCRGDKSKPYRISYPAHAHRFIKILNFWKSIYPTGFKKIELNPMNVGDIVKVNNDCYVKAFETIHREEHSLGYKLIHVSKKLKTQYVGQDIPALLKGGLNKDLLNEKSERILLAYCLDAVRMDYRDIQGAKVAILDCAFLRAEDRKKLVHFTFEEALCLAEKSQVENVLASHISVRYDLRDYEEYLTKRGSSCKVHIVNNQKVNKFSF